MISEHLKEHEILGIKGNTDSRYVNITGDTMTGPLIVQGAITGTSLTDGTATLSSGNLTGMGNITGDDVDLSLGTGNITTSGLATVDDILLPNGGTVGTATYKWLFDETNGDITTDGNVGIGTTSPLYKLDVNDEIRNSAGDLKIQADAQGNVVLFGDTDVGNDEEGKSLVIHRRAAEGDASINIGISAYKTFLINYAGGSMGFNAGSDKLRLQYSANSDVQMFDLAAEGETQELEIYGYRTGDAKRSLQIGVGVDAADTASFDGVSNYYFDGNVGIGVIDPETLTEWSSTVPYLTLHNTTEEDTDYGRESRIIAKGEQSGTEETTLGYMEFAHDGTGDDQKGIFTLKLNDGTDGDTPTAVMTALANGNVGIGISAPEELLHLVRSNTYTRFMVDSYDDGAGYPIFRMRKSKSDTIGTKAETIDGDVLGAISMMGVDSGGNFDVGFEMRAVQNGSSNTKVPTDMYFESYSSTGLNTNQFVLHNNNNVGIGVSDPDTKVEIYKAGTQLKLSYDATNYITLATQSDGDLTIDSNKASYDLDFGDGNLITTGIGNFGSLVTPYTKTVSISPAGGDYTTIQAALTANTAGGELFIVYPGTYTNDTINFTANNQCVVGAGLTPQQVVTAADAVICNFGAFTGCRIQNIKMTVTAATSAIDTVIGSTGEIRLRDCHVAMTNSNVTTSDQPSCIEVTGAGTVIMNRGTIDYNNDVDDTDGATAIKRAVTLGTGAEVELRRMTADIDGSNQSLAMAMFYGTSTGIGIFERSCVRIDDLGTTIAAGMYFTGSGTSELYGNDVHVTVGSGTGYGAIIVGTVDIRSMLNHYHIIDTGGTSYSFSVGATASLVTQLDDIIADDGVTGKAANITYCHSASDGNFDLSGALTVGGVVTGDLSGGTAYEGTAVASTGEGGASKYLREDGDGTCSWQTPAGSGDLLANGTVPLTADWDAGNSLYDITAVEFKGALKGNADTVTNATLTTALTVNTGTLTLTADAGNDSVLTIGGGAVSVSGSNTGDNTVCTSGDATTAETLKTARDIYGNSFNGSADITAIIASTYGGTGNGFTKFTGATTAEKSYALPDANATLLYSGGDAGTPSALVGTNISGTGANFTAGTVSTITGLAPDTQNTYARTQYLIPYASSTTAFGEIAIGTDGQVLTSGGAGVAPSFEDAAGGSTATREEVNSLLNAYRIAVNGSLVKFNLMDGIMDEFEDESGVDTGTSTNEDYDSSNDLYSPATAETKSISQETSNDYVQQGDVSGQERRNSQSFTLSAEKTIDAVGIELDANSGSPSGDVTIRIETDSSSVPSGTLANVNATKAVTVTASQWNKFSFDTPFSLSSGTYWIVFTCADQSNNAYWTWKTSTSSLYAGGNMAYSTDGGSSWTALETYDQTFRVYTDEPGNMTLVSNSTEAEANPDTVRIVVFEEDVDAITENTDLKAYASRDNGGNWVQATLTDEGDYESGQRLLTGEADVSGQASDKTVKWKVETLNEKDCKIHGIGYLLK